MSGFVYFLTCHGRLKVGFARDVRKRVVSLQNSAPFKLRLVGSILGNKATERAVHDQLAPHWSHGEWFEYSPEAQAAVAQLLAGAAVAPPPKKPRKPYTKARVEFVKPPWAKAISRVNQLLDRHEELIFVAPLEQRRALYQLFAQAAADIESIIDAEPYDESLAPAWLASFESKLEQMRGLAPAIGGSE